MKVTIEYHDNDSLTVEEVVRLGKQHYGQSAEVKLTADSSAPHDLIYFALQQIVSHRQFLLIFDSKETYQKDIKELRAEVLQKVSELLDTVIIDNESKIS